MPKILCVPPPLGAKPDVDMSSLLPDLPPVHLDTDSALAQIGDVESLVGMLGMLEETLTRDIPAIESLLAAHDVVGANRLLHPLKGFLPIFCRPQLCEHVTLVEVLSKDASCTSVGPAYAELKPELQLLLSEVSAYLNRDISAD